MEIRPSALAVICCTTQALRSSAVLVITALPAGFQKNSWTVFRALVLTGSSPVVSAISDFGLIEKEEGTRLSNDYKYNEICNNLYEFNDTSPLPRSEREKAIAAEFKKINVIVHFVD